MFLKSAVTIIEIAFCLSLLTISIPVSAQEDIIASHNKGVTALKAESYEEAERIFREVLARDPEYLLARENLGILYNNLGLKEQSDPKKSLFYFHKAAYCCPQNPTNLANLNVTVEAVGKNPKKFEDRVKLGDEALANGDSVGAIVEYREALKIAPSNEVAEKLAKVPLPEKLGPWDDKPIDSDKWLKKINAPLPAGVSYDAFLDAVYSVVIPNWHAPPSIGSNRATVRFSVDSNGKVGNVVLQYGGKDKATNDAALAAVKKLATVPKPPAKSPTPLRLLFEFGKEQLPFNGVSVANIDYGPYMANVQKLIKQAWVPPRDQVTRKAVVIFTVDRDAQVGNLKIEQSSGNSAFDQAGLNAVRRAKLQRPPAGAPKFTYISFNFDYNMIDTKKAPNNSGSQTSRAKDVPAIIRGVDPILDQWQDLVKKDPTSVEAHLGFALALGKAGAVDKAIVELNRVLELDPSNQTAKEKLATLKSLFESSAGSKEPSSSASKDSTPKAKEASSSVSSSAPSNK